MLEVKERKKCLNTVKTKAFNLTHYCLDVFAFSCFILSIFSKLLSLLIDLAALSLHQAQPQHHCCHLKENKP